MKNIITSTIIASVMLVSSVEAHDELILRNGTHIDLSKAFVSKIGISLTRTNNIIPAAETPAAFFFPIGVFCINGKKWYWYNTWVRSDGGDYISIENIIPWDKNSEKAKRLNDLIIRNRNLNTDDIFLIKEILSSK